MAVAISKSIELPNFAGVALTYWKLTDANINVPGGVVIAIVTPYLDSSKDTTEFKPAHAFAKSYSLTFVQAGLNTSQNGNQMRDRILQWIVDNIAEFSGGTLV